MTIPVTTLILNQWRFTALPYTELDTKSLLSLFNKHQEAIDHGDRAVKCLMSCRGGVIYDGKLVTNDMGLINHEIEVISWRIRQQQQILSICNNRGQYVGIAPVV